VSHLHLHAHVRSLHRVRPLLRLHLEGKAVDGFGPAVSDQRGGTSGGQLEPGEELPRTDFTIEVFETGGPGLQAARFSFRTGFAGAAAATSRPGGGNGHLDETGLRVRLRSWNTTSQPAFALEGKGTST